MNQKQVRETLDKLPSKRKQVLLRLLEGESKIKIACELCEGSEGAVQQHLRQLYKNFRIEGDEERKLPSLIALFVNTKEELLGGKFERSEVSKSEGTSDTVQPNNSPIPCTAYKEETWVGREEEIRELSQKLRKECRILIITGITGQGKTALAERLASVELGEEWQRLPAVNFDDGVSRDFVGAADVLLTRLGETVTPQERSQPEFLLNRLVQKLRSNRYLVQIDSVEVLLQKGDENPDRNEFEDARWWEFFQQLLAGGECQSRLILTSQHLPTQFSSRYKNFWHKKPLSGLSETEQLQLFSKLFEEQVKNPTPTLPVYGEGAKLPPVDGGTEGGSLSEAAVYLLRMGNTYEGHPLLIEVLAGEILEHPYNGNVVAYWRKHQQEFAAIAPARNSEELERNVKDRVRETLKRLEKDVPYAYTLLLRSSVYRLPVREDFWLAMLQGLTDDEKNSALGTLKYRYLVEIDRVTDDGKNVLRQHNLIRNVAYQQRLIEISNKVLDWQSDHYIAAQMWGTAYQPEPDASNLEQVRGYLEAFHHYCEIEDTESAAEIIFTCLDTPTNEQLHNQLETWGYYRERVELYKQFLSLLDESDLEWKAICFNGLGNSYCSQGDYALAINFCQQDLDIATQIGDKDGIALALSNLGVAYDYQGDYAHAINFYQNSLAIATEIGNKSHIGKILGNLGIVYFSQGDYAGAIDFYEQSLDIATEIGDKAGIALALCNLGNAYHSQGDYACVIDFYEHSLAIAREIGNKALIGTVLGNLGIAYNSQGEYARAIDFYQQDLAIAREMGNRWGEAGALCNLANTLIKLEQYLEAQKYWQISLKVFREIGARYEQVVALNNLAELYQKLGQRDRALEYGEQALALSTELGIPLATECQKLKEELLQEE
ncbi:tetratricopeptide repeat protein [Argonema galeatum]|uniref:tetratricopeptide repeat protein n=1 Tax=Argonema galeatum TaxID=2942762 RepID=UPI002012179F|nr:tetratricopeptide repeat protein [Argonema galeatum]MCL1468044.1 tetratricopeptide repeat protein [Argonema galeatum A003/A1]